MGENLSVVIPAFNEELGIGIVVEELRKWLPKIEIIVVDDCSTDATAEIIKKLGVIAVSHNFNLGQGAALKTGMRLATREFVAWFDADNEHRAEDLYKILERISEGRLVAIIGRRSRSATLLRGVSKWFIRMIGRSLKINAGSDLNCGLRIFNRKIILQYLHLIPNRFSSSLITTLIMIERGYPMEFYPVQTNQRLGSSTVRMRDGMEAILQIIRCVLLFAPLRFFCGLGIPLILIGLVYGIVVALFVGLGIPVGGMLLIAIGMLLMMIGLITDQISQMRLERFSQMNEFKILSNEEANSNE